MPVARKTIAPVACLRGLLLACAVLPPLPAVACSRALGPKDDLPRAREHLRTVVIGEVISIRAVGRMDALRQHRERVRRSAAPADTPVADGRPLRQPPAGTAVVPVMPAAEDGPLQVELFVYESLLGEDPEILVVPAGGHCGLIPRVGQQAVVMVTQDGLMDLVFGREGAPLAGPDPAWLDRLRNCLRGPCDQ